MFDLHGCMKGKLLEKNGLQKGVVLHQGGSDLYGQVVLHQGGFDM